MEWFVDVREATIPRKACPRYNVDRLLAWCLGWGVRVGVIHLKSKYGCHLNILRILLFYRGAMGRFCDTRAETVQKQLPTGHCCAVC